MRFVGILMLLLVAMAPKPALAYSDCASTVGGDLRALLRGVATTGSLVGQEAKSDTDAYTLLARAAPFGSPVAKLSLFSSAIVVMNCGALEGSDEEAVRLRQQLAEAMGIRVTRLTADRAQKWLLERLKHGTPGQFNLLSEAEQRVVAGVLCYAAEEEPFLATALYQLSSDAMLPPCE